MKNVEKTENVMGELMKNWQKLFIICLILPIILNLILYFFFNNLSFLIIAFNILYYLVLIFSIYELKKYFNQKSNIRSQRCFLRNNFKLVKFNKKKHVGINKINTKKENYYEYKTII